MVGHDNQLKKLLLSWVSFLTSPNIQIGIKRFPFMHNFLSVSMIVFLWRQNLRFTARRIWLFFQVWEWRDQWMIREWSFCPVKPTFWLDIVCWPAIILNPAFIFYSVLTTCTCTFICNVIYFSSLMIILLFMPLIVKGQMLTFSWDKPEWFHLLGQMLN